MLCRCLENMVSVREFSHYVRCVGVVIVILFSWDSRYIQTEPALVLDMKWFDSVLPASLKHGYFILILLIRCYPDHLLGGL